MKYHYEIRKLSDDYFLSSKGKPTKCDLLESLEDEGWEIFSIKEYRSSPDWKVIVRKIR